MVIVVLLSVTTLHAQIKNATTETVKIYGSCDMCKATIETAGSKKKASKVDWNQDTKMAVITYDASKTNKDEILKNIALAGYDSDQYLAPDEVYAQLPGCCQYDRVRKTTSIPATKINNHAAHGDAMESKQKGNALKTVFDAYFTVKDALIQTDGAATASKAKALQNALITVKTDQMNASVREVWTKVSKTLIEDAGKMGEAKDITKQRNHFMELSKNMYALMKVADMETPVYYQFCPMADNGKGANWLSKENTIKNPYYGSQMLNCGKTVETIK